jgi:DNA-binding NtrC family response regulator
MTTTSHEVPGGFMTGRERRRRVLVADDEKLIADTLAQILNARGFDAKAAYSGEQALEMAPFVNPDVLIADVIMGGMNGVDTAISIKKIFPRCRVILCSGQVTSELLVQKAEEQGYRFDLLFKPVHPRFLLDRLDWMWRADGAA